MAEVGSMYRAQYSTRPRRPDDSRHRGQSGAPSWLVPAMTEIDMSIFAPREHIERDPYNGMTKEEHEEYEAKKRLLRSRQREVRKIAANPATPNRDTWHCGLCMTVFKPGQEIWLIYEPKFRYFTARCSTCHADHYLPNRPNMMQCSPVRDVVQVPECREGDEGGCCRECGENFNPSGDGWDGLCPTCADRAEEELD